MGVKEYLHERTQAITEWVVTDLWPELRAHIVVAAGGFWNETVKPTVDLFFEDEGATEESEGDGEE